MKFTLATVAALALTAGAAFADPVEGTWQSKTNENGAYIHVKISACGAEFCGTITKVTGDNQSSKGKRMIWGMKAKGDGVYRGGKVWAPDDDKTYNGKLELQGNNSLKISGCVLGICRGEPFSRVN